MTYFGRLRLAILYYADYPVNLFLQNEYIFTIQSLLY